MPKTPASSLSSLEFLFFKGIGKKKDIPMPSNRKFFSYPANKTNISMAKILNFSLVKYPWGSKDHEINDVFLEKTIIFSRDLVHQQFQGRLFFFMVFDDFQGYLYNIQGWIFHGWSCGASPQYLANLRNGIVP